jgi:hypothetical protein
MGKPKQEKDVEPKFKRCPECFAKLPLDAKQCNSCDQKVEGVGQYGLAKKPIDWTGYFRAIGLWLILICYLWWAFFR